MKKILSLILAALTLVSCSAKTEGDPFSELSAPFEARVTSVCEGFGSEFVYDSANSRITFLLPEELCGFSMQKDGGRVTLSYGEVSIELSEYSSRLMRVTEAVFGASSEEISDISAREVDGALLTAVTVGELEYLFSADGTLKSISGTACGTELAFTVTELKRL